jgi:hypothetical protein
VPSHFSVENRSITAGKPRLFISHSSSDTALTKSVVDALSPAIGDHPGFEMLVDQVALTPGIEWLPQLHAMAGGRGSAWI